MEEIWRDIIEYDGLYQVSNFGRVKGVDRMIKHQRGGLRIWKGKFKNQTDNGNGYYTVCLSKNGVVIRILVHRLVAQAFPEICGEWFDGCEVDHINTIRTDNRAENLRVCTCKENNNNPITRKRNSEANCKQERKNYMKRIFTNRKDQSKPVVQLSMDGTFLYEYESLGEAERASGIRKTNISACCLRKPHYKSAGGYRWLYKSDWDKKKQEAA